MQTLKMLTAALTFASLGIAAPAIAEDDASAGNAGGQTNSTTQSTGQGSASDTTNSMDGTKDMENKDPEHARDTHTSPYKKTYPDEESVGSDGDEKQNKRDKQDQ